MKPRGDDREDGFERLLAREFSRPPVTAEPCPQVELLSAWFDRALPEGEATAVEAHLASCARCQEVLGHLARTEPEVLYVHPKPAPVRWTWHLRWAVPLGAAAVVVFAVGTRSLLAPDKAMQVQPAPPKAETQAFRSEPLTQVPPPVPSTPLRTPAMVPPASRPVSVNAPTEERLARAAKAQPLATPLPEVVAVPSSVVADAAAPVEVSGEMRKSEIARQDKAAPPPPTVVANAAAAQGGRPGRTLLALESAAAQVSAFVPGSPVGWRHPMPGIVFRTTDGGKIWTEQHLPGNLRLLALSAASATVCWGAGSAGAIVRTTDGVTWLALASPTPADLVSIAALDERRATVRTSDGVTYDTGDGGATWRRR